MPVVDEREIAVVNPEGDEICYSFRLEEAEGVCRMFVSAADAAGRKLKFKDADHHVGHVLRAQAEMIQQGLHVEGVDAPDLMLDIEAFHQKFGLEYHGKPRILDPELSAFRRGFMQEELDEYSEEQEGLVEALTSDDGKPDHRRIALGLHQQLDALVDEVYVTLGTAYMQFGTQVFHEAWRRVQAANMKKVRAAHVGQSKRASIFDVVKPEGWTPPDHHDLVRDHAHIAYKHEIENA